jgi:hypothetical protein
MATKTSKRVREISAEAARVFHPELGGLLRLCSQLETNVAALRKELERVYGEGRRRTTVGRPRSRSTTPVK